MIALVFGQVIQRVRVRRAIFSLQSFGYLLGELVKFSERVFALLSLRERMKVTAVAA